MWKALKIAIAQWKRQRICKKFGICPKHLYLLDEMEWEPGDEKVYYEACPRCVEEWDKKENNRQLEREKAVADLSKFSC